MRAIQYNDKLTFETCLPEPKVSDGQCVVRVHLAGISPFDLWVASGHSSFRGIPGHEMVGTVVDEAECGSARPSWRGKRVVCEINCVCRRCDLCLAGLANHCRNRTVLGMLGRDGCFADFVCVPERNLYEVPESISDEEAVFVEPLAAAYQVLAQCPIETRQAVSVVGAGRLGLLVAQVLKTTGCKLSVFDRNPEALVHCEKRGIQAFPLDERPLNRARDVVVECTGSAIGFKAATDLVRPRGTIVAKCWNLSQEEPDLAPIVQNEIRVLGSRCGPFPEALAALARQAVEVRSMITRVFPLEQAFEAFEAAQASHHLALLLRMSALKGDRSSETAIRRT